MPRPSIRHRRQLGLGIPQRLSAHIVPGPWLTWLPAASWPCSVTSWCPCQTAFFARSQCAAEPVVYLASLPVLVQEGAPCLCKETIKAVLCLRLLPSLLYLACYPLAQGSPNRTSSLSRTCTTGKRQALHSQGLIPGAVSSTKVCPNPL